MTSIAYRQRRNQDGEEDAAQLRLGKGALLSPHASRDTALILGETTEFEDAGAISVSEVKVLLDQQMDSNRASDTQCAPFGCLSLLFGLTLM